MIKVEILVDLNGEKVSRTEHCEATPKAAQEWASHWTHEMVKDGFVPEGAMVTYVLTSVRKSTSTQIPDVLDVVAYLHTYAEVTTE